jgi:hypothetical protein
VRRLLCLLALVLGCTSSGMSQDTLATPLKPAASARPKRHRMGLWGELGSGPGSVRIACSDCTDVIVASGTTSYFRIGGVISKNVLIGFEVFSLLDNTFGFGGSDTNTVAETGTAAIVLLWYPGKTGLFFKGGVGAAFGQFAVPADTAGVVSADTSTGGGIGLTFGLGWDVPISRKFAITANAAAFVIALGDVVLPGHNVDDVIATNYQLSIGFVIR